MYEGYPNANGARWIKLYIGEIVEMHLLVIAHYVEGGENSTSPRPCCGGDRRWNRATSTIFM